MSHAAPPQQAGVLKPVPQRTTPLPPPANGQRQTGLPLGATPQDTHQAWRGPIQPPAAGAPSPTTSGAQQTESANPLSGDGNSQPAGKTQDLPRSPGLLKPAPQASINPGKALGYSLRGTGTPAGDDLNPGPAQTPQAPDAQQTAGDEADEAAGTAGADQMHVGGVGDLQGSFKSPTVASAYHDFTKKLFSGNQPAANTQPKKPGLLKPAPKGNANDKAVEDDYAGSDDQAA